MVIVVSWLLAVKPCPTLLLQGLTLPMDINQPSSVTASPTITPGLHRRATIKLLSVIGAPLSIIVLMTWVNGVSSGPFYGTSSSARSFGLSEYSYFSLPTSLRLCISSSILCQGTSVISTSSSLAIAFSMLLRTTIRKEVSSLPGIFARIL